MNRLLTPAVLFAAMMTPATACTDWKAVAAFDAIVVAHDAAAEERCAKYLDTVNQGIAEYHRDLSEKEHKNLQECVVGVLADRHYSEAEQHRAAALADNGEGGAK